MHASSPEVSVIMPARNRADTIGEAMTSILGQTFANWELLVVDDGSTDETAAMAERSASADPRVTVIRVNAGGGPRAMNIGVSRARSRWIARLDADDVAVPERLAIQLAALKSGTLALCGGQVQTTGSRQGTIWFPECHASIEAELVFRVAFLHSTVCVARDLLLRHPYREDVVHDDYEWQTRVFGAVPMANLPECLVWHRVHADQSSQMEAARFRRERRQFRLRYLSQRYRALAPRTVVALALFADGIPLRDEHDRGAVGAWIVESAERSADPRHASRLLARWEQMSSADAATAPGAAAGVANRLMALGARC